MALPISEKPKSLQWLCTVGLLATLALSSPALSATTATQLDWPCSALNKPDSLLHSGPLTSCVPARTTPPTHPDGSLPHLQVSAPLPILSEANLTTIFKLAASSLPHPLYSLSPVLLYFSSLHFNTISFTCLFSLLSLLQTKM